MHVKSVQSVALSKFDSFFQGRIMLTDHFVRVRELCNISINAYYDTGFSDLGHK